MLSKTPAAQYLRASTEHQQYSTSNQAAAIAAYAEQHGLEIVQTFSDAARSGLDLSKRSGLQNLLTTVVSGQANFGAILVYDVSRWGRFQDTDESAHYEFLCKSAGARVHYCAEPFVNDDSLPSVIFKALKRTMAGEYSRELSTKVYEGHKRLALLGYKQGGRPGFGFRRMLLDSSGKQKGLLGSGERKSIATDRVILVPGPGGECAAVRRMFTMFAQDHRSTVEIARTLNAEGILNAGVKWNNQSVGKLLRNPKYMGTHVYGRLSTKLRSPAVRKNVDEWVACPGAWSPIITAELFEAAQRRFESLTVNLSNEQMLEELRRILRTHGKLTKQVIDEFGTFGSAAVYKRFHGFRSLYRLLGYKPERSLNFVEAQLKGDDVRADLILKTQQQLRDMGLRPTLSSTDNAILIRRHPVYFCLARQIMAPGLRWAFRLPKRRCVPLVLCKLDDKWEAFEYIFLPRGIASRWRVKIKEDDPRWAHGERFRDLQTLAAELARHFGQR
ncbi:MAG: recombinase family protein [Acidobacteriales bacterium]|nr:recombinase family protein [Terriglobales bacterium]